MADGDFLGFEDSSGHLLLEDGSSALLLEELIPPVPILAVVGTVWFPSGTPFVGTAYDLKWVISWSVDPVDPTKVNVRFLVGGGGFPVEEDDGIVQFDLQPFEQAMLLALPYEARVSMSMDGLVEYAQFPDLGFLSGAFSISTWIKTTDAGPGCLLGSRASAVNLFIGIDDQRITISTVGTNAQTDQNVGSFRDGQWHHLVVTKSGAGLLTIYVDGTAYPITVGSSNLPYSLTDPTGWYIGRCKTGDYYQGLIDETTIWVSALTAGQVTELYNGGTPLDPQTSSAVADLRVWFRMGEGDTAPDLHDVYELSSATMVNMDDSNFVEDAP